MEFALNMMKDCIRNIALIADDSLIRVQGRMLPQFWIIAKILHQEIDFK
jgi:hypothetical protein